MVYLYVPIILYVLLAQINPYMYPTLFAIVIVARSYNVTQISPIRSGILDEARTNNKNNRPEKYLTRYSAFPGANLAPTSITAIVMKVESPRKKSYKTISASSAAPAAAGTGPLGIDC